jgi:hypothetical protein
MRSFSYSLLFLLILSVSTACSTNSGQRPEPHLELGQRLSFVGGDSRREYVIVGYRQQLEDKTEKDWDEHDYIVVVYSDKSGELKQGVIHRNSILKK